MVNKNMLFFGLAMVAFGSVAAGSSYQKAIAELEEAFDEFAPNLSVINSLNPQNSEDITEINTLFALHLPGECVTNVVNKHELLKVIGNLWAGKKDAIISAEFDLENGDHLRKFESEKEELITSKKQQLLAIQEEKKAQQSLLKRLFFSNKL